MCVRECGDGSSYWSLNAAPGQGWQQLCGALCQHLLAAQLWYVFEVCSRDCIFFRGRPRVKGQKMKAAFQLMFFWQNDEQGRTRRGDLSYRRLNKPTVYVGGRFDLVWADCLLNINTKGWDITYRGIDSHWQGIQTVKVHVLGHTFLKWRVKTPAVCWSWSVMILSTQLLSGNRRLDS